MGTVPCGLCEAAGPPPLFPVPGKNIKTVNTEHLFYNSLSLRTYRDCSLNLEESYPGVCMLGNCKF